MTTAEMLPPGSPEARAEGCTCYATPEEAASRGLVWIFAFGRCFAPGCPVHGEVIDAAIERLMGRHRVQ